MDTKIWTYIVEAAKKQGLSFLILLAVVWYFLNEVEQLKKDILVCHSNVISIYEKQNSEMQKLVILNTEALNRNTKAFEAFENTK